MGAGHCQWGGLTDIPKMRPLGPLATAVELVTDAWKARKYIRIDCPSGRNTYKEGTMRESVNALASGVFISGMV